MIRLKFHNTPQISHSQMSESRPIWEIGGINDAPRKFLSITKRMKNLKNKQVSVPPAEGGWLDTTGPTDSVEKQWLLIQKGERRLRETEKQKEESRRTQEDDKLRPATCHFPVFFCCFLFCSFILSLNLLWPFFCNGKIRSRVNATLAKLD